MKFKWVRNIKRWYSKNLQRTFKIYLSDGRDLYYVPALSTPDSNWVALAAHTDFPPPEHDPKRDVHKHFGAFVMGFGHPGNKHGLDYWRACLPFRTWKVMRRNKLTETRHRNDPLIRDYISLEEHYGR